MIRFLKKYKLLFLSLLIVVAFVGSTYAYLVATDNQIVNSFKFAKVDTSIEEDVGGGGKKVVTIQNKEISSVYVRARVLISGGDAGVPDAAVNFVTEESIPEGNAINVVWNSSKWERDGDWFYYEGILQGKADDGTTYATEPLITKVCVGNGVDTGSSFEVDVYQESILTSDTSYFDGAAKAAFLAATAGTTTG